MRSILSSPAILGSFLILASTQAGAAAQPQIGIRPPAPKPKAVKEAPAAVVVPNHPDPKVNLHPAQHMETPALGSANRRYILDLQSLGNVKAAPAAGLNEKRNAWKDNAAFEAQEASIIAHQHEEIDALEAVQAAIAEVAQQAAPSTTKEQDTEPEVQDWFPQLPALLAALNALSYVQLLMLTSKSHKYYVELIQLIAFACFPTLPIVQFFNNAWKTIYQLSFGSVSQDHFLYFIAGITGTYVFPRNEAFRKGGNRHRVNDLDSKDLTVEHGEPAGKFILGLLLMMLQIAAAGLGLAINVETPVPAGLDTLPVGQDQRRSWTAVSGMLTAILSLLAHLCVMTWTLSPPAEKDKNKALPLMWEADVFMEIVLAALLQDLAVAYVGGRNSLIGLMTVFMANRVVLIVCFIGVLLFFRRLKKLADQATGPKRRYSTMRPLFIGFSIAVCGAIVMLQLMSAVNEQMKIRHVEVIVERGHQ